MAAVYPSDVVIEADLGAGFVELADVLASPIDISRGIQGSGQRDRVASTGTMTFQLDNSANNSAGLLGLYSPHNSNVLAGWELGVEVRCVVTYDGSDLTVFRGTVAAISPVAGQYGSRRVHVACVDWMDEAAQARLSGIAVQIEKRSDQVLATMVAAVDKQPFATDIGAGGDLYAYSLDNAPGERINLMSEFQRLMQTELGYLFVLRDGTLKFQSRFRRPSITTLSETLTGADIRSIETSRGREEIINKVQVQIHPRRVDTAAVVLFTLGSAPELLRSTSIELRAPYRDPLARATRAGGIDMVTPVVTTDYTGNTLADGSGVDISGQLSVSASFGGNEGTVTVTNNGPHDGFLTKLQLRGKGVYAYESVIGTNESAASIAKYGEREMALDMPYQGDIEIANEAARYLVGQSKTVLTPVTGVAFSANYVGRLMDAALEIDIGERVRVTETVIGTAEIIPVGESEGVEALDFFVQSVNLSIEAGRYINCSWGLAPADPYNYWILEVAGYTELNETTRLGYGLFVTGWILGESALDSTTILD